MNTTTSAVSTAQSSSKFSYKDFTWCLSLFGTAVGGDAALDALKCLKDGARVITVPTITAELICEKAKLLGFEVPKSSHYFFSLINI